MELFCKNNQRQNPRKFYIRRNNNKVDTIETGRIVIAYLLPCMCTTFFLINDDKILRYYLIYKYNFICLLFWTTRKSTNDVKII